jgi:hypothetical protein
LGSAFPRTFQLAALHKQRILHLIICAALHHPQSRGFYQQSFWLVFSFWLIPALFSGFVWRNRALLKEKFPGWLQHLGYFQSSVSSRFFASNFSLSKLAFRFGS